MRIYIYVSLLILSGSDLFRVVLLHFLYALIPCTKYNYNLDLFPVHNITFNFDAKYGYGEITLSGLANIT